MNKNRVNGTVDELVGSAKRKAGSITHNTHLHVEGIAQQGKGKVESALGKVQEAIKDAAGNGGVHVDGHVSLALKTWLGKDESGNTSDPLSDAYRTKES